MTICLLDVNVVIALIDPAHVQHGLAHDWFARRAPAPWATCPLVENGVMRIVGNRRYPDSPGTPAGVVPYLRGLREAPGHQFWPDDVNLIDDARVDVDRLLDQGQLTDTYLLALARSRGGRLATFDKRIVTDAVESGQQALCLIR